MFIGPDVHIGTDEYNKKEAEQYRYFTDRYLKYIEKYGKTPRMWGGLKWLPGKTPVKAEGVTVNAWSYDWVDPEVSLKMDISLSILAIPICILCPVRATIASFGPSMAV